MDICFLSALTGALFRPAEWHEHGAAQAVTGCCFPLETESGQVLIMCGLLQGSKTEKELNYRSPAFQLTQDQQTPFE
jgi:hypothetical protein